MLFCVDNSGSMADKQGTLAKSFATFINQFKDKALDFHIGIVTTDTQNTSEAYWQSKLPNYVTPNRGRLLSRVAGEKWLSNDSQALVGKFQTNAKVGTIGSGRESCFQSMLYALDDSMIGAGGYNEGFLREGALFAGIIVSDENEDMSHQYDGGDHDTTIDMRIKRVQDRIAALKANVKIRDADWSFIINKTVGTQAKPYTYPLAEGLNPFPEVYTRAAEVFGSPTYNICPNRPNGNCYDGGAQSDFGGDLATVGSNIITHAQSEYKLTYKPADISKIVVKMNGNVIAMDPASGWSYDSAKNSVALASSIDPSGATITIDYNY